MLNRRELATAPRNSTVHSGASVAGYRSAFEVGPESVPGGRASGGQTFFFFLLFLGGGPRCLRDPSRPRVPVCVSWWGSEGKTVHGEPGIAFRLAGVSLCVPVPSGGPFRASDPGERKKNPSSGRSSKRRPSFSSWREIGLVCHGLLRCCKIIMSSGFCLSLLPSS